MDAAVLTCPTGLHLLPVEALRHTKNKYTSRGKGQMLKQTAKTVMQWRAISMSVSFKKCYENKIFISNPQFQVTIVYTKYSYLLALLIQ